MPLSFPLRLIAVLGLAALLAGCAAEAKPVAGDATNQFRPADSPRPGQSERPAAQDGAGAPDRAANGNGQRAGEAASKSPQPEIRADNVEDLVRMFVELGEREPQGRTPQEQIENLLQIQETRLAVAEKALSLKPDRETKAALVNGIYGIHQSMRRFGVPGTGERLQAFARSLASDEDPDVSRFGRHIQFELRIQAIASRPLDSGEQVVEEIEKLLAGEKGKLDGQTLEMVIGVVAQVLMGSGLKDDAVAALNLMADAAAAEPELADSAADLRDQATLVKADLRTLLGNVLTDEADAEASFIAALRDVLGQVRHSEQLLSYFRQLIAELEFTGHHDAAIQSLDHLAAAYAMAEDEQLKERVQRWQSAIQTRIALVGQPFSIEGVTLDGEPFDWSAYAGKVVLIDFWATWCVPCLQEIPNIHENYQLYRSKGFEVVGVNLNTDAEEVQMFFDRQSLPWPSVTSREVLSGEADKEEFNKLPMAAKYGVDAIPFLVLVGKDGNVDSIHVQGPKLRKRLTELLGEPEKPEVPVDPTVSPPPDANPGEVDPGAADNADPGPALNPPAVLPPVEDRGAIGPAGGASPVAWLLAQALFAADELDVAGNAAINPYLAKPGLSTPQLVAYIEKMLDKPQTIQTRPGFGEAVVEACDRVLAGGEAKEPQRLFAAETKFQTLHRLACDGDAQADERLMAFVAEMKNDSRETIARHVKLLRLERRVLDGVDLPIEDVPALIEEVREYAANEKLTGSHLRLASGTVALINRLEDGDAREKHFASLGGLFAKSGDKELARYGQKLAKSPAEARVN